MQFIHGQSIDSVLEEVKRLRRQTGLGTMPDGSRMEEPAHSQNESVAVSVAESLLLGRFSDSEPKSTRTESIKPRHNVQELPGLSGASKTQPRPPSASPLSHLERAEILEKAMNGGEQGREEETDKGRPDSVPASALPPLTPGSDLTTLVESKYYRSVAQIGIQVAEALAYAHGQGVLHRDIKPSNLLLDTAGRVWITDFGLAKTEDSEELTSPGDMVGTLRYMAPERLRGQADPRSDVYSLGVTLYEMLTLQPAFQDSSRAALIDQITTTPAKSPRRIDPHIPRDLETMVLKAIAKEPNKRYASAGEMAEDLRRFLADRPIRARRASVLEQSWRWSRRNPALAATAGLAATALTAAAVLGFSLALQQHNAAERLGEEQRQTVAALTQVLQEKQQTQAAFNEAEIQKRTAERLSATYALDQGISLCERGDVALGMLWLTHSLRIMPDHAPELQHAIRANLAGWKRELRPLKALLKHNDAVWAIAYSPDGELILTGGWDKQARLWNANTGAPIGDPWPHEGYVWSVAFSPDCHRAVIGADGGAQMWDIAKGERIGKPLRSENSAGPVAFSPDGQSVFTAYGNGKVQRWDAATGEYRGDVCSHGDRVYCLAAYGRTIVTGGEDNCARLWDVDTGQAVGDPLCHQGVVRAVAFSHNGLQILTASFDGFGRLWQAATQKPIGLPLAHHDKVISVAFSQDDRLVLTGSDDGTAQIWDAATCQRLGPPLKHRSQVSAVAFNPKGSSFATGGTENVVRLWDTRQESWTRPEVTLPHDNKVRGLAVSPDGRLLLTAGENGTGWVWDLSTRRLKGGALQHDKFLR